MGVPEKHTLPGGEKRVNLLWVHTSGHYNFRKGMSSMGIDKEQLHAVYVMTNEE